MERVAFNRLLYQQFNDRYRSFLKKNDQCRKKLIKKEKEIVSQATKKAVHFHEKKRKENGTPMCWGEWCFSPLVFWVPTAI